MAALFDAQNYQGSPVATLALVVALATLLAGLVALARRHLSPVSIPFFLVALSTAVGLATSVAMYCATGEHIALWWGKAEFMSIPFVAPAFYHLSVVPWGLQRRQMKVVLLGWGGALFFSAAGVCTGALIKGVSHNSSGYYGNFGELGWPFVVFFTGIFFGGILHCWSVYSGARMGVQTTDIMWLVVAPGAAFLSIAGFAVTYGIPVYPAAYLAIAGFIVVPGIAMWRLRVSKSVPATGAFEIITSMDDALFVVDREGVVRLANRAAANLFGKSVGELTGSPLAAVSDDRHFSGQLRTIIEAELTHVYELDYQPGGRSERVLSLATSVIKDDRNRAAATLCIARDITHSKLAEREVMLLNQELEQRVAARTQQLQDANKELWKEITERREVERALRQLATRDELTNLYNLREMKRFLAYEIKRTLRYKHPFSLVMLDVDHFRQVNESYGQQAGDEVLRWIADLLIEKMRSTDRVARYGGEEMAVILPETTYVEAYHVAEDLRLMVAGHLFVFRMSNGEITTFSVTISLGLAEVTAEIASADALIEAADLALSDAKAQGRNRTVHYYPEAAKLDISGGDHQHPFL